MDRQALRDAVARYNAEGLDGMHDRPTPGRPQALTAAERALLSARIFRDPDPEIEHAVMVLDGAGSLGAKAPTAPPNVTLAPLPPCSPQFNPMERVWLHLRERFLSLRMLGG